MPQRPDSVKAKTASKFLPYELPYVTDELKKLAKSELFEDENTRTHSLQVLRSMLDEETNLYYYDDDSFLIGFLRARKFDVKRAFNLIKTFYRVKAKHEELYSNYNFEDVRKALAENSVGYLPYRDEDGCVVILLRVDRWNPVENPLGDMMRAITTSLLDAIRSPPTQIAGFKVIVDFKGVGLSKIPHITPKYLWLFAEALQNCFPARFKAVHLVNEGHIFGYVWVVLKQCLSKKLRDRFHFHNKNVTKLHKYISPRILPEEYGGDLPTFDNSPWAKRLEEFSDYFTLLHTFGYKKPVRKS